MLRALACFSVKWHETFAHVGLLIFHRSGITDVLFKCSRCQCQVSVHGHDAHNLSQQVRCVRFRFLSAATRVLPLPSLPLSSLPLSSLLHASMRRIPADSSHDVLSSTRLLEKKSERFLHPMESHFRWKSALSEPCTPLRCAHRADVCQRQKYQALLQALQVVASTTNQVESEAFAVASRAGLMAMAMTNG